MELATIFGILATLLGVIGGWAYIYDTYRRKTLPHRFAWFIFLLISIISFASQAALGAEASLFYAGLFVFNNIVIWTLSLRKNSGRGGFTWTNILGLTLALLGIALWVTLSSPLAALMSVLIAEVIGALMIVYKSYLEPKTETILMWTLGIVASSLNIMAVGSFDFALLAFPIYLFLSNVAIVSAIYLGARREKKMIIT